ncbi:MAG: tetratricopeptide repeat protein [Syntrophaceae bacterium]|nr:tetratricopeptide repeat protein [Syntrophaceae bacterium]
MKIRMLTISIILVVCIPCVCVSETTEIVSEGIYNMGDGETPIIAEGKALEQAKRVAIEQAGTYVKSYSTMKNFQIAEDEVQVLASGIMEVTVLDKKRTVAEDAIKFWVKIKALVYPDRMEVMAERIRDQGLADDYGKMKDAYEKSQKEIEELKKQLAATKDDANRKQIVAKITEQEKTFTAGQRFDEGMRLVMTNNVDEAIAAFSKAIADDPHDIKAYTQRAILYAKKMQIDKAIADFNKVIEIKPDDARGYAGRGITYSRMGRHKQAIADLARALELQQEAPPFFLARVHISLGNSYRALGNRPKAIANFKKSCELGNKNGCKQLTLMQGTRRGDRIKERTR